MTKFNQRLRFLVRSPKYLFLLLASKYLPGLGWYSYKPSAAYRPREPLYRRIWNRHFVSTRPSSEMQDQSQALFPGRQAEWYLANDNVRIALEGEGDFRTTYDVYAGGHYDRLSHDAAPGLIVVDIGAKLGVASLIFAQNPNIDHIYAYEPLPHTFDLAMRSIAANPRLSPKITLTNIGIGKNDRQITVSYSAKVKAAIGLSNIPSSLKELYHVKPEDMEEVVIRLTDATKVLHTIRASHPGAPILLKLDAEGAEYEIIDRLIETGTIQEIRAAAIEWHDSPGEGYLTSHLLASGFQVQAKSLETDHSIGMIDAWRQNPDG